MISWFGRKNPGRHVPAAGARNIAAEIAEMDSLKGLATVTEALEALTQGRLPLEERFDEAHLLDSTGQPRLVDLIKEYMATARHKKSRENEIWGAAYAYLQALHAAYQSCLARYEADPHGSVRFKLTLPIAIARALRAVRLQLKWTLLRYASPEARIWTDMAELYTYAQTHRVATVEVQVYPGRQIAVREEFAKGLMVAACSNDTFRPAELDYATRLVDHYARLFTVTDAPFDGCTHWFDLDHPGPPMRIARELPRSPSAIYIGAGAALAELASAEAHMAYGGGMPKELMFYDDQDEHLLLSVVRHLALDWAGKAQARKGERRRVTSRVTVVPGLKEILQVLEFAGNDSLDFTNQPAAESWIAEDASDRGYGAVIPSIAGDWVEVGSLVGIEGSSIREWRIGIIRRVNRLQYNNQRVGVELLGRAATLVTIVQDDGHADARDQDEADSQMAVLITADAESRDMVEVIVRSGMFTKLNETKMTMGDRVFRLMPTRIVERSARAERVAFQVLKVYTR